MRGDLFRRFAGKFEHSSCCWKNRRLLFLQKKKGFAVENAGQLLKIKKHPIQQFSWPVPEAKSSRHSFRPSIIDLVLNSRAGRATGPVLGRA